MIHQQPYWPDVQQQGNSPGCRLNRLTGNLILEKSGAKTQKEAAVMRSLLVFHMCVCVCVCRCVCVCVGARVCVCVCVCVNEEDQPQVHWAVWRWKEISAMHRQ